ncbi:hypothetical protein D3C71_1362350 [compost metagenome]
MEGGHQRRALAAGRHVAAAEVGHHRNAGPLCQQGRVAQLQRVPGAIKLLRTVAHGLPVGTNRSDRVRWQRALLEQGVNNVGVGARQCIASQGRTMQFVVAGGIERHELGAKLGRKRGAGMVSNHHAGP